jgi:hypothetical protein
MFFDKKILFLTLLHPIRLSLNLQTAMENFDIRSLKDACEDAILQLVRHTPTLRECPQNQRPKRRKLMALKIAVEKMVQKINELEEETPAQAVASPASLVPASASASAPAPAPASAPAENVLLIEKQKEEIMSYQLEVDALKCDIKALEEIIENEIIEEQMFFHNIYPAEEAPFEEINSIANLRATVNLECPICYEPLSDEVGVMLAENPECGHPLCLPCYEQHRKAGFKNCPVCIRRMRRRGRPSKR